MQTSYKLLSDRFAVGQITDGSIRQVDGQLAAENVIQFGQPVRKGTDKENQVKVLDGITAGLCIGFAVRSEERITGQYEIYSQVDVIRFGRIAVIVKEAVLVDDDAYVYADATIVIVMLLFFSFSAVNHTVTAIREHNIKPVNLMRPIMTLLLIMINQQL